MDKSSDQLEVDREKLHRVTATILSAFDVVVLPWMDVEAMVQTKGARALSKDNKRKGLLLGHGVFRQRLIHHLGKASMKSRRITWVTEQYTSKICGRCFRYNGYLGGSRVFKCPNITCGVHIDRDGNAARNIWVWGWLEAFKKLTAEEEKERHSVGSNAKTKTRSGCFAWLRFECCVDCNVETLC